MMTKSPSVKREKTTAKIPAYSYIRFSTLEQQKGQSLKRQKEMRTRYLKAHPELGLDETKTFRDLGKGAFHGMNVSSGALGAFLAGLEETDPEKKIGKNSVLLVEAIDRISRQNPWDAVDVIKKITKHGIRIITLEDDKEYSDDTLKADSSLLTRLVGKLELAHDESERKSRRIKSAWRDNQETATSENIITEARPNWLRIIEDDGKRKFDFIPERAAIIKEIFEMRAGENGHTPKGWLLIADELNRRGRDKEHYGNKYEPWGEGKRKATKWHASYIQKLLKNRALLGDYQPHERITRQEPKAGETLFIRKPAGQVRRYYYPILPAFAEDKKWIKEFETNPKALPSLWKRADAVTLLSSGRPGVKRPNGESNVANLFAGITYLRETDQKLTLINKGRKKKNGGIYGTKVWRYLGPASGNRLGRYSYWEYDNFENLFLDYVQTIDWKKLASTQKRASDTLLGKRITRIRNEIKELQGEQNGLLRQARKAKRDDVRELLEKEFDRVVPSLKAKEKELQQLEAQYEVANRPIVGSQDIKQLRGRAKTDPEARRTIKAAIQRHISRIELFPLSRFFLIRFNTDKYMCQQVWLNQDGTVENTGYYSKTVSRDKAAKVFRGQQSTV